MNQENNKIVRRRIGESAPPRSVPQQAAPQPQSLDQKITACLSNDKAVSDDIEHLSREVETDLAYATRKLEQEKVLSLNPNLDADEALHTCKLAQLQVERLQHSLVLLQQKHSQALEQEYHLRWLDRQQAARVRRDAASARFARVEALINEIVATFAEAMQADQLVNEANGDSPVGEKSRLLRTEEHARGLDDGFPSHKPSLMKETVLYDFNGNQVWPIRARIDPAVYGIADYRRYPGDASSEWWKKSQQVEAQQTAELAKDERERDDFYHGRQT
jgi:hypothetical protein